METVTVNSCYLMATIATDSWHLMDIIVVIS
jgi:hypothetical protein